MNVLKRLSFDTSAVNALTDNAHGAALLAGIQSGYFTRITFPSIAEAFATSDEARRNKLFDTLNALRQNGECLEAHHWILSQLVKNYATDINVKWHALDIRFAHIEEALVRRGFSNNESDEERNFAVQAENQFTDTFANTRPRFEVVFEEGTERPTNADELLAHLNGEGGAFWIMAANLYQRAAGMRPTEEQIRAFVGESPPFLALMLGLVHAQFEWSIREQPIKKNKRVGRIDLFCAIYLPYCDIYVTDDDEQRRCLTEIAATAKLPVEILSLASFADRLMLMPRLLVGRA
jgi:hypothetical protein